MAVASLLGLKMRFPSIMIPSIRRFSENGDKKTMMEKLKIVGRVFTKYGDQKNLSKDLAAYLDARSIYIKVIKVSVSETKEGLVYRIPIPGVDFAMVNFARRGLTMYVEDCTIQGKSITIAECFLPEHQGEDFIAGDFLFSEAENGEAKMVVINYYASLAFEQKDCNGLLYGCFFLNFCYSCRCFRLYSSSKTVDMYFGSGQEEESEPESPEAGKLYVGNLPYAITSAELSQVFGEAGDVDSVEIVYDRVTDRSRGFAFITMASVQEATEAIRMFNGSQIGGRTVKVNFPEVPRGGEREVMGPKIRKGNREFIESPYKIYAGNLSWIITSERLKDAFADQPGLLSAKVIYEKQSGRSRGFGFVTFSSPEAAESALYAMNEVEVEGRPLRLNLATGSADTSRSPQSATGSEINDGGSEIFSSISSSFGENL
ncbi:hypothetical protein SSX86_000904 [Deinandra increscens subsp. villosa]|uniref:RRM domain-containing protein n=1 Tax=Deinandra increscens subsp. villosa TaxID=3103831 RepID=A0AAP0DQM8_9ASTR